MQLFILSHSISKLLGSFDFLLVRWINNKNDVEIPITNMTDNGT